MRPLHLVFAILLGFTFACGFMERADAPHFTEQVPLSEPWTEMSLPMSGATVTFSDDETVTVRHPSSEGIATLGEQYGDALKAAGFTLDRDDSSDATVNQTWTRGDDIVSLAVLEQTGDHVVSIAFVPF